MSNAPTFGLRKQYVPEPLVGRAHKTREVPLDILNVVQLRRKRVIDVNDEDLPVGLALVEERHDTEDLDLLDLADVANLFTNLADIERVVVAVGLGLSMGLSRVLPGLHNGTATSGRASGLPCSVTHLGEGTVVPDVPVVGEAVAHVAETALLDVLLDGVEGLLLGHLHLRVGPAGDLNDHV